MITNIVFGLLWMIWGCIVTTYCMAAYEFIFKMKIGNTMPQRIASIAMWLAFGVLFALAAVGLYSAQSEINKDRITSIQSGAPVCHLKADGDNWNWECGK